MGNVINRSAKNPNLRSRNAFGRAGNRPSSLCPCLLYQTFPGTKFLPDFCLTWYKVLVQTLFYLPDFMVQIFFWYNFSGTISFSGTKTFGFAFGLRSPICVRWTRSAISHLRSRTPMRYASVYGLVFLPDLWFKEPAYCSKEPAWKKIPDLDARTVGSEERS